MLAEIEIDHVSQMGHGVGYDAAGNIYFVEGAIPGDTVEISFSEHGKRYRDAELLSLKKPSPERVPPVCPHFQVCGGCDWLQWEYRAQLDAKEKMLMHLLERNDIRFRNKLPIAEAPSRLEYRNRIQLHCQGDKIGFNRRRSHEIVEIEYCHLAHPKLNQALRELREKRPGFSLEPRFELLLNEKGTVEVVRQTEAESFLQVNTAQNERLRLLVAEIVRSDGGKNILELYCGDGNLTFAYRPPEGRIIAIDASSAAIEKARKRDNGTGASVDFRQMRIDGALRRRLPAGYRDGYDTLILDPPRAGADLASFVHNKLMHIIYVSCSPGTFVRDVRSLKKEFAFETLQAVDMFPHTRHIEFVSYLKRLL
ncbi:MAG: class I SAM-dependent RNA methyltransferase [Spirochaetales bacterium]|nr:class I SAM-dependent RNA methyltransferase [Spirochaetales bacterium]